ncbi:M16 family metallopeptidase [Asticcacaulis solisilvae]|uniref:M16 family metallopeptidase n=1 Tax=Asticcacaulis solisilvae TaxID=1217274 RepID=UPI003FD85B38
MSSKKSLLPALAVLALASTALTPLDGLAKAAAPKAPAHAPAHAPAKAAFKPVLPDPKQPVHFAQDYSDIKADPNVRFGRLANGMTYAILKNATPPGTASFRLRIGGGSMMETEQQRGLAHFLEHMAFNGSKNVPEGDMVKILERHGLKFGPDTNAFTSFDQTVYELDLPKVADDDLDTALFLLRETAGNLTLAPDAIDRERGVILGEERLRDSPDTHQFKKWAAAAFTGQKYAERLPIGLIDVIKNAKQDQFQDFYNAYYRPERGTVIAVGDFDVDKMEAKIKAKFGDWAPAGAKDLRLTDFGAYTKKPVRSEVYTENGLPDGINLTWAKAKDEHYQTEAKTETDFLDQIRTAILNDRLERQAKKPDTAFSAASLSQFGTEHTADGLQLSIEPKPGQDKAAFEQAYATLRQFRMYGADQTELDRVVKDLDATYKAEVEGEKTRNNRALAESLVDTVNSADVFTSPTQDYAFFKAMHPKITLASVNGGINALFDGDGPLIWHSAQTAGDLDKAALSATFDAVNGAKLAKYASQGSKVWPYTAFGTPSAVVKRDELKDLGVTELTYANGVKAIIKPTKFKENEIGIIVQFAGGQASLSPGANPPVFEAQVADLSEGGLGKLDANELKDSLTGKIVRMDFSISEDASQLSGATTPTDFETQMQLLMAFTTDAAYRADAWERLKSFVPNYYTQLGTSTSGVFQLHGTAALHSGDPRFGIPAQDDFLKVSNDQVKALIERQLKSQPIEITIVGDISEDKAEAVIAKTFATLAPRTQTAAPADAAVVRFPTANLSQSFEHHGRADQDLSYVAWPTNDFFADTKTARGLEMLANVMQLRLIDVVRENKALSYSPNAGSYASDTFAGYGYLSASAEVKPDQDQTFYDALSGIVADLKAKPISDDELLRARKPVLDKLDNDWKTNAYWLRVLPGSARDPRTVDAIRSRREQINSVTAADIQTLANTYLDMAKAMRIQIKPAKDASAAQ